MSTTRALPRPQADSVTSRGPWIGLGIAVVLMVLAVSLPRALGWEVRTYSELARAVDPVPPLHARWDPKVGVGTVPAVLIALLSWKYAVGLAERLPWRRLLLATYVTGLAWMLALAYVDGSHGISRVMENPYEYLDTAVATDDVPAMLEVFTSRIPNTVEHNWATHVAGHPPGALLVFVALVRLGVTSAFGVGIAITLVAATTAVAVMVALRALDAERLARRALPFLVLGPAAIWMSVSADAVFTAAAAWGLALLAIGATREGWVAAVAWSALAGVVLGYCVLMSYGLPLLGLIAVAILLAARSWLPLPVAAATALAVVLVFAAYGFKLWDAYPVLQERYWAGVAADRPASYWMWGNLAALAFAAGPLLGAGLGRLVTLGRAGWDGSTRTVTLLVAAAAAAIVVADLSRMSKAEVERIWLPFVPWLLLSVALLPERWRRVGLGVQLLLALAVQHLLYTGW